jgi:hypothetical protein
MRNFEHVRVVWIVSYRDRDGHVLLTASVHDAEIVDRLRMLAGELNISVEVHDLQKLKAGEMEQKA